jgi:hypothetical protein
MSARGTLRSNAPVAAKILSSNPTLLQLSVLSTST